MFAQKKIVRYTHYWKLIQICFATTSMPSIKTFFTQQINILGLRTDTWTSVLSSVLPMVVSVVTAIQAAALIHMLNLRSYESTSRELFSYTLTTIQERLFAASSIFILLLHIVAVVGLFSHRRFGWIAVVAAAVVSIVANIIIIAPIGLVFSLMWLYMLLCVREEYAI